MDTFKKIFVSIYALLVVVAFTFTLLDGAGVIALKEGSLQRALNVLGVSLIPVVVAAIRTKDFWKDDPSSIANLKRQSAEFVEKNNAIADEAIAKLIAVHENTEAEHVASELDLKRQLLAHKKFQVPRDDFGNPLR
jgi:uncharacterized membrane protein YdfJ with MMPL/SSD domain